MKNQTTIDLEYFLPDYQNHIAIVANGQFPERAEVIRLLEKSRIIIACDGAIQNLIKSKITADYIVGDGDSVCEIPDKIVRNPYIHIADQNSNDLTKAFNYAKDNFPTSPIIIFAANGLREDHSIANFGLLFEFSKKHDKIAMISDYGIFNSCRSGKSIFNVIKGQQISLFSLKQTTQINCPELKWPLSNFCFNHLYSGTLNQASGNQITIETTDNITLYRAYEIKAS